jgi:hypothetical protein
MALAAPLGAPLPAANPLSPTLAKRTWLAAEDHARARPNDMTYAAAGCAINILNPTER